MWNGFNYLPYTNNMFNMKINIKILDNPEKPRLF